MDCAFGTGADGQGQLDQAADPIVERSGLGTSLAEPGVGLPDLGMILGERAGARWG
jgi:hypothetical protein